MDMTSDDTDEEVHFVEDLEERKNSSPGLTTLAVGEEELGW